MNRQIEITLLGYAIRYNAETDRKKKEELCSIVAEYLHKTVSDEEYCSHVTVFLRQLVRPEIQGHLEDRFDRDST